MKAGLIVLHVLQKLLTMVRNTYQEGLAKSYVPFFNLGVRDRSVCLYCVSNGLYSLLFVFTTRPPTLLNLSEGADHIFDLGVRDGSVPLYCVSCGLSHVFCLVVVHSLPHFHR